MKVLSSAAARVVVVAFLLTMGSALLLTSPPAPQSLGSAGATPTVQEDRTAGPSVAGTVSSPRATEVIAEASLIPLAPAAPAEAPWDDCSGQVEIIDGLPPTVEFMSSLSSSVILGSITEVGPGRWNTEVGRAPADEADISPHIVMRLLRVEVEQQLAYSANSAPTLTVWVRGGTIGCSRFSYSEFPDEIEPGQRFVFFLDDHLAPENGPVEVQRVYQMWPVDAERRVTTPVDGVVTVEELAARATAGRR